MTPGERGIHCLHFPNATADLGYHVTKVYTILSSIKGLIAICVFHNSLIIHGISHQIVFGYFALYFLLFITITYDMNTAQKIVNNSMKENRLALKVSSLI